MQNFMRSLWNAKLNERTGCKKGTNRNDCLRVENIFFLLFRSNHLSCLQKYASKAAIHIGHKMYITHARFSHNGYAFFSSFLFEVVTMLLLLLFRMQLQIYCVRFSTHSIACLKFTTYALYKYRMYICYNALSSWCKRWQFMQQKGEF